MHYWGENHYIVSYDAGINTSEVRGAESIAIDIQGRLNSVIGHRAKQLHWGPYLHNHSQE